MKKRKAELTPPEREQLIEETLNSLDNMQRAALPEGLQNRVMKHTFTAKGKVVSLKPMVRLTAAASIVLLLGVNILSVVHYNNTAMDKHSDTNAVYSEYFSYFHNF